MLQTVTVKMLKFGGNMEKRKISPFWRIFLSIIGVLALVFIVYLVVSKYTIKVTRYGFESEKVDEDIVIVQISDLHGKQFGKDNRRLIEKVSAEEPDLIFMTGDMHTNDDRQYENTLRLIPKLSEIAPVYFCLGNHEELHLWEHGNIVKDEMEACGASLCEKTVYDVDVNGNRVRIGGTIGYALSVDFWEADTGKKAYKYYFEEEFDQQRYLLKFQKTDALKLLLIHRPEGSTLWAKDGWYDVDFVFSGHTHGGIVRIPGVGGLISPEEGFWPEYDYGLFTVNGVNTIITSGLGNSAIVPRINNVPEIVSIIIY